MKELLKFEFLRLFKSKWLYISMLIGIALSVWLVILSVGFHNVEMKMLSIGGAEDATYFFPMSVFTSFIGIEYSTLPTAILFAIFPILVTMPFSASFCEDKESGYLKNIFIRTKKTNYFLAKYITVFTSGVVIVMTIFIFSLVLTMMFIPAIMPEVSSNTFPVSNSNYLWSGVYRQYPYLYLLLYSLLDAVFLGLISTISLAVSTFIKHKFAALAVPMVLYVGINYVFGLLTLGDFMPEQFLRQYQPVIISLHVIIIEAVILLIITAGVFIGIGL